MSWKERPRLYGSLSDQEREELKRLCEERDRKLKPGQWKTIITDEEMEDRKRLGMKTQGYITLTEVRRKMALENPNFIHRRPTLQQELEDRKFFEEHSKPTHIKEIIPGVVEELAERREEKND
jgi:hypothetical protein